MADAEQVSSTTPNEVEEDEMKRWSESGFREATAQKVLQDGNVGLFGGEWDVKDVRQVQKAAHLEEEEEEEVVMSRQEEMDLLHTTENKAETECLEKSVDLISKPVECESPEEPDSTQMKEDEITAGEEEDTDTEESLKLVDLKEVEEVAITAAFPPPVQAFTRVIQDQDPVVSSATELQEAFRSQEILMSTKPQEEIFFKSELEAQDQDFSGVSAGVKVEAFSAPAEPEKAVSSVVEQEKEPERRNLVEESFRVDSESTPAASASPSAYEPSLPSSAAPATSFPTLMQFTSEYEDSSLIASTQPSFKATMDSFCNDSPSRSTPRNDPDVLSQSDDDLMFETKRNPFQDFSPVEKPAGEFSPFGETAADVRAAKMSDSPSPDLVQNAHEGELQGSSPMQDYEQSFDSREAATESLRQQLASSDFFGTAPKDNEESGLPPSLPDILKSSPRNHDKVDSGSSEGSPDFSPVHRSGNDSPNALFSLLANNSFAFEAKVPLVKEMTEETEAKAAERVRIDEEEEEEEEEEEKASEQMFGTFDLVKEAEISPKATETIVEDQDDFKTLSQDSAQMVDKFECLSFPTGKAQEHSDSESPSADSLSPVLEAMAKNPASFQIELEKNALQEEAEAEDEVSEQEVSSEEFEFVEKPPRGAVDEFLETLENSKFAKASEMADDDDDEDTAKFEEQMEEASPPAQETKSQSYFLLTDTANETSPARGKAGLELSDFQVPSQAPSPPSPVVKTETVAVKKAEPKDLKLPNLNAGAVVELLYWRDVKNSGIVFGASLLLLLSLSVCSIISVLSYVALALLSVTISFRIYKGVLQAIQKSDEGHPFKLYLEKDVSLPDEVVRKYSDIALGRINTAINELRHLFLVEDLVDSLKFAVLMWILTYVGALFNGLTLLILGLVALFTCPIVYEKHQAQIDHYIALVRNQVKDIVGKIQAKIPGAKKKAE
ncbi:reticulon-4b isoform X1 [Ictalurus punctatus]|uniref:Reticulon n=1 Tax=Ictalurus punctatus TaxID=7998 RepID=A0A2D0QG50_ICTPU|nr:reticulon-4b isoform X1 [Ictalurus punctatus]